MIRRTARSATSEIEIGRGQVPQCMHDLLDQALGIGLAGPLRRIRVAPLDRADHRMMLAELGSGTRSPKLAR